MDNFRSYQKRESLYQFLIDEFGAVKLEDTYDEANFGNFSIILGINDFLINYVNDRSFLTIEVANRLDSTNWYPLSYVMDFIYKTDPTYQNSISLDNNDRIKYLNRLLRKDLNLISKLFNNENYSNTRTELDIFLKEKGRRKSKK